MLSLTIPTQLGLLTLWEDDSAIVRVEWEGDGVDETLLLREAALQLGAYDAGELEVFDLPLLVGGSNFQREVCSQMATIPFGVAVTYGYIAKALKQSPQADGSACGGNPMPVIIPCHRVMGAKG